MAFHKPSVARVSVAGRILKLFSQSWQKNTGKWVEPVNLTKCSRGSVSAMLPHRAAPLRCWTSAQGWLQFTPLCSQSRYFCWHCDIKLLCGRSIFYQWSVTAGMLRLRASHTLSHTLSFSHGSQQVIWWLPPHIRALINTISCRRLAPFCHTSTWNLICCSVTELIFKEGEIVWTASQSCGDINGDLSAHVITYPRRWSRLEMTSHQTCAGHSAQTMSCDQKFHSTLPAWVEAESLVADSSCAVIGCSLIFEITWLPQSP